MTPEFISPAKLILLKCKSAHVPSPLRTLQRLPISLWKSQSPSQGLRGPMSLSYFCNLSPITFHCLFSSNNVTCASWTFPDTLAPLHVYSSPCKCYRPSLASGPCSNTILERRISLSISSYPALFFTGYLSPLCLFIFLWSVFPSSVWAPLK